MIYIKKKIISLITLLFISACVSLPGINDNPSKQKPKKNIQSSEYTMNDVKINIIKINKLTEEDIELAAIKSSIHENIKSFPKGYQTLVGERGVTLSGGQKQRISIARALVRPTSILIFDDCLSALDNETESKIQEALKILTKNKTTIGFVGAPWTVLVYMINQKSPKKNQICA